MENKAEKPITVRRTTEHQTTWKDIKKAASNGTLDSILKSGDLLPLVLKDGSNIGLIVGRDETGKTYFVFQRALCSGAHSDDVPCEEAPVWRDSSIRNRDVEYVLNLMPKYIRDVIAPTKIVQCVHGKRIETEDLLFIPSRTQIFGKIDDCNSEQEPEDTQIDVFKDPRNRIVTFSLQDNKYKQQEHILWWTRTLAFDDEDDDSTCYHYFVEEDGVADVGCSEDLLGTIFMFCVESSTIQ